MEILKVSSSTHPASAAGALAEIIKRDGQAEVHTIGAAALNQGVKAIIIASGYVATAGISLICTPGFTDIVIDGEERTGIRMIVRKG